MQETILKFLHPVYASVDAHLCTDVSDTGGKWKKILYQKSFNYFDWTPLGSRVNILINFFKFTLRCRQSDIVPIICHQCRWPQWQIATSSTTQAVYQWQNLPPMSLITGGKLPPVSLILVVHLDLQISPGAVNFRKNLKWLCFQWLEGRWFMKKTWSKKSCDTVPKINKFLVWKWLRSQLKPAHHIQRRLTQPIGTRGGKLPLVHLSHILFLLKD